MNYYEDLFLEENVPRALTQEELYEYFERYKNGDFSAREVIINGNIRLVLHQVIKKYLNTVYDKKELVSIGVVGLIKAVDNYDISKNFKFATYAARCINNEINMFIKKGKKYINDISFEKALCVDENGNEMKFEEILNDESSDFVLDYERQEICLIVRDLVESLSGRDKEIIELYFGFGDNEPFSQREIAEKFNISQVYVSKILKRILKKFSEQLKRLGVTDDVEYSKKVLRKENDSLINRMFY